MNHSCNKTTVHCVHAGCKVLPDKVQECHIIIFFLMFHTLILAMLKDVHTLLCVTSSICWPLTSCHGCEVGTTGGPFGTGLVRRVWWNLGGRGKGMKRWCNVRMTWLWSLHPNDVDTICVTVAVRRCCAVWCCLSAVHKLNSTVISSRDLRSRASIKT